MKWVVYNNITPWLHPEFDPKKMQCYSILHGCTDLNHLKASDSLIYPQKRCACNENLDIYLKRIMKFRSIRKNPMTLKLDYKTLWCLLHRNYWILFNCTITSVHPNSIKIKLTTPKRLTSDVCFHTVSQAVRSLLQRRSPNHRRIPQSADRRQRGWRGKPSSKSSSFI